VKLATMLRRMIAHAKRERVSNVKLAAFASGRVELTLKDAGGSRVLETISFEMGRGCRVPRKVRAVFKKGGADQ